MSHYRAPKGVRDATNAVIEEAQRRGTFKEEVESLVWEMYPDHLFPGERELVVRFVSAKLFDGFVGWSVKDEWRLA